jgi:hypothetical protein
VFISGKSSKYKEYGKQEKEGSKQQCAPTVAI